MGLGLRALRIRGKRAEDSQSRLAPGSWDTRVLCPLASTGPSLKQKVCSLRGLRGLRAQGFRASGLLMYCTILYFTILYTILYYTILYYTLLYHSILYYTTLLASLMFGRKVGVLHMGQNPLRTGEATKTAGSQSLASWGLARAKRP